MGQNGIFRSDTNDTIEGSFNQWRDKRPVKSLVVGRPILLALEDIDGGPSFLEKALRFLEKYGIKVEGILRQSADVEEVDRRVQEYEQGKTEFDPEEDAHVIGDCVKHVLRELPSSPVPASCCTALLEAYSNVLHCTLEIDRIETRVNAMRSAILEAFPEPNRRLLQRVLKMMHTVSSHASENRMTPSAVAACMAPLLLRPLLAGECELEDDYDTNGDSSAQLLAAANAANNAQAIVTTLLEEYDNIFDDDSLHRCSMSVDSKTDNSGSEDTSDDDNPDIKVNGYHDAENEVDPETDVDSDRRHSGKLSESSGSAASDLYDYKAVANDDSDDEMPIHNNIMGSKLDVTLDTRSSRDSKTSLNDQLDQLKAHGNTTDVSTEKPANESQRSVGEILSSMNQELQQSFPGPELLGEKALPKITNTSTGSAKKSTFWGKKNARKTPSSESIDSSGEEELSIQRLEIAKNDLRHRIAKEARGNAILQASLERRKQALHERRLALEQDVARLQEQLQAERDLRAALEVGLSMSSGQFSGSRGMDSKTRAELEEIALAEADVARLKQKVAELHHQLNQQRQHHYGSISDACDRYQHTASQTPQQNFFKQDFDTTLAVCNHERRQRTEESMGADGRNIKGQLLAHGSNGRLPSRKQFIEPSSLSDSKSTEASTSLSVDDFPAVDSGAVPSTSRVAEVMDYHRQPLAASSALVELTTRLDFFKERRSQLMEQLHNLDLNYGSTPQDFAYKPSSPPWH
ncbi:rho GTPase-activating protein 7-like [Salvia splendens]|uniref:rho GTPase-activating protein 7-like n=1 Tax=Salvia splendens TaxID=180675 RepID=UPI001104E353|nr:rho GTPase-activating protein 7-like [Salvia splendens]XP_042002730.1 rho GTPase-activating protein 7-like [Salvia splendens]